MISMKIRPHKPTRAMVLLTALLGLAVPHLLAAERSHINITGYVIDAQLDPAAHTLKATAKANFTGDVIDAQLDPASHTLKATAKVAFAATDTVSSAIFELHNALKVDSVT